MKVSVYTKNYRLLAKTDIIAKTNDNITFVLNDTTDIDKTGNELMVDLYDDIQGIMSYDALILGVKKTALKGFKMAYEITVALGEFKGARQRRNDVKVKTSFSSTIMLCNEKNEPILDDKNQPVEYVVTVRDISATGVMVVMLEELQKGQYFRFRFNEGSKPIELLTKILRVQKVDDNLIGYGCQYVKITPAQEDTVRQYVFKCQLKARKSGKDS